MFGWLNSLYNWTIGGIADLWNKVVSAFQTVVSFFTNWIQSIVSDVEQLWSSLGDLATSIDRWVTNEFTSVINWFIQSIGDLGRWVNGVIGQLGNYISSVSSWLSGWISSAVRDLGSRISQLWQAVLRNVWDPLYNAIKGILGWIAHEGAWLIYMLTHPDKLAALIAHWILSVWIYLGHKFARPVARWIIHSMIAASGDVAGILEDFISAIL